MSAFYKGFEITKPSDVRPNYILTATVSNLAHADYTMQYFI